MTADTTIRALGSDLSKRWTLYNGDAVDIVRQLPDSSVDLAVYSPPFANLYTYGDSERDMGNCVDDGEFLAHYAFLVKEIYRTLRPWRIVCVHCKDLVNYKNRDGMAGLRDFPGELIRVHQAAGFSYHSRVTIWKDPVVEMQRTKAHGLLYKQLRTDSSFSRQGLAEYVLGFRKWSDEDGTGVVPVTHTHAEFPLAQWQIWASPVWRDIVQTNVLNVAIARDDKDEKHLCPLQLDVIERCVGLWSNPGEVVLSPFAGVGSEGVVSMRMGRRFVGVELKESYYRQAVANLRDAEVVRQTTLFDGAAEPSIA
jgi:DNA modification methylase